jgi:voltage-gated potassium channel
VYVTGSVTMILLIGSLSVLDAERYAAGSNIRSFGDALWWAFTTITTVGYGDRYPVTTTGRIIAVLLMIGGIAMLGIITGSLASWIVDMIGAEDQKSNQITRHQIDGVANDLADIKATLRTLQTSNDIQETAPNHNRKRN